MHGNAHVGSNSRWKEFLRDGNQPAGQSNIQNDNAPNRHKSKKSIIVGSEEKR